MGKFKVGNWYAYKIYNGTWCTVRLKEYKNGSWHFDGIIDGEWKSASISDYDMKNWIPADGRWVKMQFEKSLRSKL